MPQPTISSTSTGLFPNVGGALAYLLGPITGCLLLVLERRSSFVRFHAAQSVVLTAALALLGIACGVVAAALGLLPLLGGSGARFGLLLPAALSLVGFALWLLLMYRAYQGEQWELPLVGGYAHRLVRMALPQAQTSHVERTLRNTTPPTRE